MLYLINRRVTEQKVSKVRYRRALHLAFLTILVWALSACNSVGISTEPNILREGTPAEKTVPPIAKPSPVSPTQTLTPHPITLGKKDLMVVVVAVEKYYEDHGAYPDSITDLIPGYIAHLPYTFDGHEIWYKPSETEIYRVGFEPSERKYCVYLKKDDYLECGFRNPELFITPVLPTLSPGPPL